MPADTTVRLARDEDCPSCGFPETYAEIPLDEAGQLTRHVKIFGCSKCGWSVIERPTVPDGFAIEFTPDPDPDFSWLDQDFMQTEPVTIYGQEIPPEDYCNPDNHEAWLVDVIRLHDDSVVDSLGNVDLWHPTSPLRSFYAMGEACGYREGEELPEELAFLLDELDFRSNTVVILSAETTEITNPPYRVDSLVCPHCHAHDTIEEWGSVIVTHPIELRHPGDEDTDPTVTTLPATVEWDAGENFRGYRCRSCGESVHIPETWDREDES